MNEHISTEKENKVSAGNLNDKILTISIAAYNVEQYLPDALDSLVKVENRAMLDVIIVNDGSKDGTSRIAHEYEKRFPSFIRVIDKSNAGYGSTINASLKNAKGKYFKLLDGDDWVDPSGLDGLLEALTKTEADIVVTKYNTVREGNGLVEEIAVDGLYDGQIRPLLSLMVGKAYPMHALAFRTSLLVDNKIYITEHCYYTDYEYTVKPLLYAKTIAFVDENVYQYRIGRDGQSVSLDSQKKNIDMAITTSLNLARFYDSNVVPSSVPEQKKQLIKEQIASSTRNKFQIILLLDCSKQNKAKFFDYDRRLFEASKDVYHETISASSNMTAIMHVFKLGNGIFYPLVSKLVKIRYKRNAR